MRFKIYLAMQSFADDTHQLNRVIKLESWPQLKRFLGNYFSAKKVTEVFILPPSSSQRLHCLMKSKHWTSEGTTSLLSSSLLSSLLSSSQFAFSERKHDLWLAALSYHFTSFFLTLLLVNSIAIPTQSHKLLTQSAIDS